MRDTRRICAMTMNVMRGKLLFLTLAGALACQARAFAGELEQGFGDPPHAAKPHVWYHMMSGKVSKEGVTRDFEALAEAGFGGVQVFDVDVDMTDGDVTFNSPEWIDLMRHAASEARRLGLEVAVANCSGWYSSSGPWIPPSNAMKRVTFSETNVSGPSRFRGRLPRERKDNGFYEDIAVLAFPTPPAELAEFPDVRTSLDGASFVLSSDRPFTSRGVAFRVECAQKFWNEEARMEIEVSDDGTTFRPYESFMIPLACSGYTDFALRRHSFPAPLTARAVRATVRHGATVLTMKEARPEARVSLSNLKGKTFVMRQETVCDKGETGPDEVVARDAVRDLTVSWRTCSSSRARRSRESAAVGEGRQTLADRTQHLHDVEALGQG